MRGEPSGGFGRSRGGLGMLAVGILIGLGGAPPAMAGTGSIRGDTLVYRGDDRRENLSVAKETVSDRNGIVVGAQLVLLDSHPTSVARGTAPCVDLLVEGTACPFGSSVLEVELGGGDDWFKTEDQTLGKGPRFGGRSCRPLQSFASVRLDAGPGGDLVDGSRLADAITGGPGDDGIEGWDGDDRLTGGPGVDLLDGHDGDDVLEGGNGDDVIKLDANPLDRTSCFPPSGRNGDDIARGGPGSDAITAGGGTDRIEGGAGNDEMGGGPGSGRDTILGGPGRDRIFSRDGRRDFVDCGPGVDLLEMSDRADRVVGCETRRLRPR